VPSNGWWKGEKDKKSEKNDFFHKTMIRILFLNALLFTFEGEFGIKNKIRLL